MTQRIVTVKKTNGFSLIELLVVIAILGILASVATTSYRTYIIKSERTEAQSVLVKIADAQEKYYLDNNRYANQTELASIFTVPTGTATKWAYAITRTNANQQFTATATRAEDTECSSMTIQSGNNLGTGSWNADSSCS